MTTPAVLYWRQQDILSPQQLEQVEITLIGAGGIGSPTALALAKMGIPKLTVYDPDTIEEHNLPNQLYAPSYVENGVEISTIGQKKVILLHHLIRGFVTNLFFIMRPENYESQPLSGIVVSGVDSMSARRTIWEGVKAHKDFVDVYVEARMGAEVGMVYTINPKDEVQSKWYEDNMLYSDLDALEIPCTARAIIYNTFMIAALISSQVKKYIRGERQLSKEIVMDIDNLVLFHSEVR